MTEKKSVLIKRVDLMTPKEIRTLRKQALSQVEQYIRESNQKEVDKLKREEFILNELDALGGDIKALVETEYREIHEAQERCKAQQEARKHDKTIGVLAAPHIPNRLKPELKYIMARLNTIIAYLEDESQSPGRTHLNY